MKTLESHKRSPVRNILVPCVEGTDSERKNGRASSLVVADKEGKNWGFFWSYL